MRIQNFVSKIVYSVMDGIRLFIFYLGLHISTPITLFTLIFTISTVLWSIYAYFKPNFQLNLKFFDDPINIVFITIYIILFLIILFTIYLMYPPTKRAKIIVDAYGNNPRIIPFMAKDVKTWLESTISYIEQQPSISDIQSYVRSEKKLSKRFLKLNANKKFMKNIDKTGNYLNTLINGVSDSFGIPRESFEDFINTRIDINQRICKELISSYEKIENHIGGLVAAKKINDVDTIRNCETKIEDNCIEILKKEDSIKNQIKWLKELDKRKWAIPELIEIIKESSTGNALDRLTNKLLSEERVKNLEDLKWLIQFAKSRKGFTIGELLGLKFVEKCIFSWDEIPGKDDVKLIGFLKQNFDVDLLTTRKIAKRSDGKAIDISDGRNSISLKLNTDRMKVNLIINGNKIDEFKGKKDEGKLNIFHNVLELYGGQISHKLDKEKKFFGEWHMLREKALKKLCDDFVDWIRLSKRLDFSGSIAVGLTFGYSAVLKNILKSIISENIQNIKGLRILLIRSRESPGDEEILKAELLADYRDQGLKCDILPIDAMEKKETQFNIKSIFVGIESINKHGDIVHPRGGSEIIREIKKHNEDMYLFSWDEVPGKDDRRFIEFLMQNFSFEWVTKAKIEKIEDNNTIRVFTENKSLSLKLNDEKIKAILEIDNAKTAEYTVKKENGMLNIYEDIAVYAFGESYKVQDFEDIDFTKLSLFRHDYIDYVVTDHGVHGKQGEKWEVHEKKSGIWNIRPIDNLYCCSEYWKDILIKNKYI